MNALHDKISYISAFYELGNWEMHQTYQTCKRLQTESASLPNGVVDYVVIWLKHSYARAFVCITYVYIHKK